MKIEKLVVNRDGFEISGLEIGEKALPVVESASDEFRRVVRDIVPPVSKVVSEKEFESFDKLISYLKQIVSLLRESPEA